MRTGYAALFSLIPPPLKLPKLTESPITLFALASAFSRMFFARFSAKTARLAYSIPHKLPNYSPEGLTGQRTIIKLRTAFVLLLHLIQTIHCIPTRKTNNAIVMALLLAYKHSSSLCKASTLQNSMKGGSWLLPAPPSLPQWPSWLLCSVVIHR